MAHDEQYPIQLLSGEKMPSVDSSEPSPATLRRRNKFSWKQIRSVAVLIILALTTWFVGQQIYLAAIELQTRTLHVRYDYLAVAILLNILGMLVLAGPIAIAIGDRQKIMNLPRPIPISAMVNAYLISQVGKYVPGKAVVMVIRLMVLGRWGAPVGMVVLATFFETMVAMSAASLLAGILLLLPTPTLDDAGQAQLAWARRLCFFFFLGFLFFVIPTVLSLAPRLLARFFPSAQRYADRPIGWASIGKAIVASLIAWLIMGSSFWAIVQSVSPQPLATSTIPTISAVFVFSYVAGFISMVPGHFGVREFIMDSVLRPLLGGDRLVAVSATILSRLVTLMVELGMALVCYAIYRRSIAGANASDLHQATHSPLPGDSIDR
jgi:uncharacterized membrane protein YbhN (UPF0104 family)